jgi:hypothetical protein
MFTIRTLSGSPNPNILGGFHWEIYLPDWADFCTFKRCSALLPNPVNKSKNRASQLDSRVIIGSVIVCHPIGHHSVSLSVIMRAIEGESQRENLTAVAYLRGQVPATPNPFHENKPFKATKNI